MMNAFIDKLLAAAKAAGIDTAEVYYAENESFRASAMDGEINQYQVSKSTGLGLRGTANGRMGYASTQAFDDDAIAQLIEGVKDSAALTETDEQDEIFAGETSYPELPETESDLADISAEDKLAVCLNMEKAAKAADARIRKVQGSRMATVSGLIHLKNSFGLDLVSRDSVGYAMLSAIATEGDDTATGGQIAVARNFREIDAEKVGREAAEDALSQLNAAPVASGKYRVIIRYDAMSSLLQTFCGMFSAENAQKKLSLLAGREGTKIASDKVTVMDDPLLPGGYASCAFDGEGSAARTKAVVDRGMLKTLLHSRKTAKKQGVTTTGNASRAGYSSPVHVAPTNLFIQPGEKTPDQLMEEAGNGILITEVSGLHAGANAVSGDFSLLAKGFVIENGKKGRPVKQITVAGNFYQLLENVREVGNDLKFEGSSIASPSLDAGELTVSGK